VKKPTVEKTSEPVVGPAPGPVSRDRKLRDAIRNVFRLTHGRDMTPDERRLFGFNDRAFREIPTANQQNGNSREIRPKRRQ
jgi:hypothetical protein